MEETKKYAVVQCVDGVYSVVSEHSDLDAAIIGFFNTAAALRGEKSIVVSRVNLLDENMYVVDGRFTDWFDRTPEPEPPEPPIPPEPEEESK